VSVITSISNPRVADARKLRRKSFRDESGRFLIEGCRAVETALRSSGEMVELFIDRDGASCGPAIDELATSNGVTVTEVNDRVLKAMADTSTPQGIVAVARRPATSIDEVVNDASLVLVLAGISDPGNAGTLLRSAVAAGCDAVVFTGDAVDPFGPKTVRSAAGMIFEVSIAVEPDLPTALGTLRSSGLHLVGTAADADTSVTEIDLSPPTAVVIGNEAWGLPADHRALLDEVVSIPMPGPAESLNAAVAGSIVLFEAVRRRG
jgi:RNA methyltransferase, TrmH family